VPLAKAVGLRSQVVLGGANLERQAKSARGAHLIVATPGRLIDLLGRGLLDVGAVRVLVLDEADRMLDMGFKPQTDRIVAAVPRDRQTMLFSATLDGAVGDLARSYTHDPARIESEGLEREVVEVAHSFAGVADSRAKLEVLLDVLSGEDRGLALVFSRTRHGAKRLGRRLEQRGQKAATLHGDMTQAARQRALARFARGDVDVMVATDVAARGIDLDDVTHVIHFDAPSTREDFLHRSGRTGRAGRGGSCLTLVSAGEEADVSRLAAACGLEEEYRAAGLTVAAPRIVHSTRRRRGPRNRPAPAAPASSTPRGNRVARRSSPQ
jgi:superfamily II DNA/RNA helicase